MQLCADILRRQIKHDGLNIPEDVVEFIASTANGSVRELQGVINSLMAYSVVYNCDIDMQLAQRIIKRSVKVNEEPLTIDEIIESVCQHYNVTTANVNSRSRKKEYVMARQVSIYLAQKYTKLSASRIGRMVGGRDHATVIYSCNQVEQRIKIRQEVLKRNFKYREFIQNEELTILLHKQFELSVLFLLPVLLPRYGNIVLVLRQHCFSATATLL